MQNMKKVWERRSHAFPPPTPLVVTKYSIRVNIKEICSVFLTRCSLTEENLRAAAVFNNVSIWNVDRYD